MKVIFVGPSLPDASFTGEDDMSIRAPALQGDIMRALQEGATAIGLIDGQFELVAPVWHKEIMFALSKGVPVLGGASMGALRAAECADFGMIGIGQVFNDYRSGRRVEDADVALLHAPAELKYAPLSVPLVNVDATLEAARAGNLLTEAEFEHTAEAARRLFFKERSWKLIAEMTGIGHERMLSILKIAWTDQKRLDALELIASIRTLDPSIEPRTSRDWSFNATPLWRRLYPNSC